MPVFVFTACVALTCTAVFQQHTTALSLFVLLDLLVSAPLLYYLAIRSTATSKLTVLRVFVAGAFLAGLLLPGQLPQPLAAVKTAASFLAEATLIGFLFWRFYKARKQGQSHDFLWQARTVLQQVLGHQKAANLFALELAVFYYAFYPGDKNLQNENRFTMYRQNGCRTVLTVFLCLFLVETAGTHLLIGLWNPTVAWVITALGLYTCLQLFAHIRALHTRPSFFTESSLVLRNGILGGDAVIPLEDIEKIERIKKPPTEKGVLKLAFIAELEKPNTVLYLKGPVELIKPFGIVKRGRVLSLSVDRPDEFLLLQKA